MSRAFRSRIARAMLGTVVLALVQTGQSARGSVAGGLVPRVLAAQEPPHVAGMVHTPGMSPPSASSLPTQGGQAAFAAIAEVVRLLEADPATDWRTVNIERLRQHLIDMDLVTMRSRVQSRSVTGGAVFTVQGSGTAINAIKRMTKAHVAMMMAEQGPRIERVELVDGVRLTVTARDSTDAVSIARIRGLGFAGLLASGEHHAAHHLAIAQGATMAEHGH